MTASPGWPAAGISTCRRALVDAILDLCLAQPGVIEARVSTEKPDVYKDCRVGYEAVRRR